MSKKEDKSCNVIRVERGSVTITVRGTAPLLMNRMANKAMIQLLLGGRKKTAGEKATTLKHNPIEEYRAAAHVHADSRTLLAMPSTCFKNGLRSVAVDIDCGTSKAQLGRLSYVEGEYVPVWGVPELRMDVVRSADMNKTPDIRTRPCIREWVAQFTVIYTKPILSAEAIINLVANAGLTQGLGEWRPEKGKGSLGTFELVDPNDAEVQRIIREGGRAAQEAAIKSPALWDEQTAELMAAFDEEMVRREVSR
jgi:hypothetical protein